jgi:hypothetical protein
MSESTNRLEGLLKEREIKPAEFKRKFNVSPQSYVNWKNRGIPHNEVLRLAEFFNVDANWLANGVESKSSNAGSALQALCDESQEISSVKMGLLADLYGLIKLEVDLTDIDMLRRVILNTKIRYDHHIHV